MTPDKISLLCFLYFIAGFIAFMQRAPTNSHTITRSDFAAGIFWPLMLAKLLLWCAFQLFCGLFEAVLGLKDE